MNGISICSKDLVSRFAVAVACWPPGKHLAWCKGKKGGVQDFEGRF